jgi:hypothetical protein
MAVYKRGESWHIDSTFHGQRIRESMGDQNLTGNILLQIHLKRDGVIPCEAGVTEMFGILPHTFLQAL